MNRSNIVMVILCLMMAGLAFSLVSRPLEVHTAPKAPIVVKEEPPKAQPSASTSSSAPAPKPAAPKKTRLFDRPLAVISLGWHFIAPGILQNGGLKPDPNSEFSKAGLELRLAPSESMKQIENALARGGSDDKGADVAIVPLPEFVASYEALKALDPVMFLSVGWSHGEHVVLGQVESFGKLPKTGPILVNGLGGTSSTFLATFAMKTQGISLDRIELEPRNVEQPGAAIWALSRVEVKAAPEALQQHQLLSTAEAVNLVPYVAVAQRSLVDNHADALVAWARLWLRGQQRVQEDATRAARQLAKLDGGPEPLELMAHLGRITNSSVADNARTTGASGRGAVTLGSLFSQAWEVWRSLKVLTTPPPEQSPVTGAVVAPLVLEDPPPRATSQQDTKPTTEDRKREPLLVVDPGPGKLDEVALVEKVGFFAGVFARSTVRLSVYSRSVYDEKLTASLAERVRDRFDVADSRLLAHSAKPTSLSPYILEILPVN
jgi:hypothetical protein